ncbi:helix-turn-helix domain-containing protein [Streptomyces antibioticus]|uniref:helix-turn-helix domain-containing protein n=1 Tax=Streptomyces antibioticus TaxID=1890 RepID=UPI0036F86F57
MENRHPDAADGETFAQVLAELKDQYGVNDTQIASAIGAHVSTVNNWVNGKAAPRPAAVHKLADRYPKFTTQRLFAALGKRAPAPLSPDRRDALLATFDRLTEEQQQMLLIQANAVADSNEQQS